ncbi:mechanosensitive ion channel [Francisellaceae bacterium]|nr:mechanosensitive ion channel [Francisellaceae bacterium]
MLSDKGYFYLRRYLKMVCIFSAVLFFALIFTGYANLAYELIADILQSILCGFILLASNFSFRWLLHEVTRKMLDMSKEKFDQSLTAYWIITIFDFVVFCIALIIFALIWGVNPQAIQDLLQAIFIDGISIGETTIALLTIIEAVILFTVIFLLTKFIVVVMQRRILPFTKMDQGAKDAAISFTKYIGIIIGIVLAISSLGVSATSIAFIVSAFTFGLSFALRDIFSNFLSGIILMIERPIKTGDWVDVGKESGVVKKIKLRATEVETFNQKTLLIPNNQFISQTVSNDMYTASSRLVLEVECSYDDDPEKVKQVLLDIVNKQNKVLSSPAPSVIFSNFGASGLLFLVRAYCLTTNRLSLSDELRYVIFNEFKKQGIEIPYPKQDVYIKEFPAKEDKNKSED